MNMAPEFGLWNYRIIHLGAVVYPFQRYVIHYTIESTYVIHMVLRSVFDVAYCWRCTCTVYTDKLY